eukprot:809746-Amphidinium_carterae.1
MFAVFLAISWYRMAASTSCCNARYSPILCPLGAPLPQTSRSSQSMRNWKGSSSPTDLHPRSLNC